MRPLRNTERVLKNDAVTKILEKEKSLGDDIQIQDIFGEEFIQKLCKKVQWMLVLGVVEWWLD